MVAVLALIRSLCEKRGTLFEPDAIAVATTKWVIDDPTADVVGLVREVGPHPLLGSTLSFEASRYPALRRYEDFLVKEGVGAGGAAVAAALTAGIGAHTLREEIETIYAGLPTDVPRA